MKTSDFKNKKILVIGLARSGLAISKLLKGDNTIIVTDQKSITKEEQTELDNINVKFIESSNQEDILDDSFDMLIRNPGVPVTSKVIIKANKMNIPVFNEMEVAYHFLPSNIKIIGITGSNGKTTTTTLIYELLRLYKDNVVLAGNIGYPLSEIALQVKENDILVLEISDHQLYDFVDFKTDISVLTNLAPTHLDFHGNYENYMNVKKKIFNHHTKNDLAILNFGNEDSLKLCKDINSSKLYFNGNNAYIKKDAIYINNKFVIMLDDILVKGTHNYEDIMASLLTLNYFINIYDYKVLDYLKNFKGVKHRLELVKEISGIKFYNDSKSTNPTSTLVALKSLGNNIHLILGGKERNQDFNELNEYIKNVKVIYAIGEVENRVIKYANDHGIKVFGCNTLKKAVIKAKEELQSGDILLLSPASASWDQYAKFEDRGDEFIRLVEDLYA